MMAEPMEDVLLNLKVAELFYKKDKIQSDMMKGKDRIK